MPRHGLNQLLNSISVCLVLLTGLGIGAWVSQLGHGPQSAAPADSYADAHAEEEDEDFRQPVKRKQVRRNPLKKRALSSGKVRQVTYHSEDSESGEGGSVPEPETESSETFAEPSTIPARIAALPSPLPFAEAALGQPGPTLPGVSALTPKNIPASGAIDGTRRTPFDLSFDVTVAAQPAGQPPASTATKVRISWTVARPIQRGFADFPGILEQHKDVPLPVTAPITINGLGTSGTIKFKAELLNSSDVAIPDAEVATAQVVVNDKTQPVSNQILQIVRPDFPVATQRLVVPPATPGFQIWSRDFTVILASPPPAEVVYQLVAQGNGRFFPLASLRQSGSTNSIPTDSKLTANLPSGEYKLWLLDDWTGEAFPAAGTIVVPQIETNRVVQTLTVTDAATGFYSTVKRIDNPQTAYPNYLKVRGTGWNGTVQQAKFYLFNRTAVNRSDWLFAGIVPAEPTAPGNGDWTAELTLPDGKSTPSQNLIAVSQSGTDHVYSPVVPLNQIAPTAQSLTPAITSVKDGTDTAVPASGTVYQSNAAKFKIVVADQGTLPRDAAVLVCNPQGLVLTSANVAGVGSPTEIPITLPGPGDHQIAVRFTQGPKSNVGPMSSLITLRVISDGPTVANVIPKSFGSETIGKEIRVTFDTPVEIAVPTSPADLKGFFKLNRRMGQANSRLETDFAISSAELSPNDKKTVILTTTTEPPVDSYRLIIKGTLKDTLGNTLRGDGLNPGTEYSIVLSPNVALSGGFEPEIPAPKRVKHVEYQEYTQGRTNPPDFLPSDHVETRVSRLYYFRDAHRVAQIMNRGVESLNRAATTMQKQLADKARRQADQGTDERRAFELRASQAAQTARQAEAQLEEEQLAQAQAEQEVETMTQAIEADNVRIAELKDDLTAMQGAAAQNPPPANPPTPQQISQLESQIQKLQFKDSAAKRTLTAANAVLAASGNRISAAMAAVQTARDKEIKATNDSADAQAKEDRLREDQFRREVAAAQEDPDTYVGGVPTSNDPVAQVSISVIGEGVIQLRGPLSGINKIRQSINQIDQPVGQVRISIHTAQVNGEHGDRMEKVVNRIDNYIEHARFLTTHSTELLRQSILQVAAEKAMQAAAECPNGDQASQEVKYLDAFFGADFIDQLEQMDSEFLHTGNKLLSLHSMDTTSLASALFVMALAKNDTRMEILAVFNSKLEGDLPQSEMNYHQAGFAPVYCGDGKLMARRKLENGKNLERSLMALNAKFVNFSGFFNATVSGPDTLNPTQREFLKLAQIFKSRMITEIELRQRVVERGLIEQNDPDRQKRENDRRIASDEAQRQRDLALTTRLKSQSDVANALAAAAAKLKGNVSKKEDIDKSEELSAIIDALEKVAPQITESARTKSDTLETPRAPSTSAEMIEQELRRAGKTGITIKDNVIYFTIKANGQEFPARIPIAKWLNSSTIEFDSGRAAAYGVSSTDFESVWNDLIANAQRNYEESLKYLNKFNWESKHVKKTLENERTWSVRAAEGISSQEKNQRSVKTVKILIYGQRNLEPLLSFRMREREKWEQQAATLSRLLVAENYNHQAVLNLWVKLKIELDQAFTDEEKKRIGFEALVAKLEQSFENLGQAVLAVQVAERIAKLNSFPLDHRRFLDFLIAETEDKYIELLEGTRSHTANIDNYIKRLITALDDDFNTQFYKPAFQGVRQASRLWDVSLAQIETTSILTNNRMFGKVSPQATMEFDLPKRDLLIKEALNGAMASYQEYGALLNDPTFLSMTKLRSGQPTSSPSQRGAGESAVRNVLPGLPSATDEQIMGQAGPGNRELDSPLESLIPDPAIYKFETGTGFEVRPVIQPDGQAVVFHFNYMYRTNVREPIRADEKHLGRVKQHFIDTDVQLSNFELRKVSDYTVALKTSRTSRGVPLMEDVPGLGVLFRPLPSAESSLQQNVVMAQATIFPTLFDLMGLRWAPAVADLDEYELQNENHTVRGRRKTISNKVYDFSSEQVDTFLQIPETERRKDLYRSQKPIPARPPQPDQGYEYLDQPAPNAMPATGPSDRPNDPRMVPPLPAARRTMPQRQASRIRERGVSAPPAAPGPDAPPAIEVEQLPPPLEQPATQQGVQPGAQGQSGPVFIEQLPPNGNSSSSKRRTGIRSLIQPVGGVQADGSKWTSIIDAGYYVEQPRVSRGGSDELEQARVSKGAPPAAETAGRAKVGSGPAKSGMPRLPKLSWPKRGNQP